VLLATRPVDFHKEPQRLAALAAQVLCEDPFSGAMIVFGRKQADRIKLLAWDGSGPEMVWKRLTHGGFRWLLVADSMMKLWAVGFAALLDGLDSTRVQAARRVPTPTAAV
jgi:transposase